MESGGGWGVELQRREKESDRRADNRKVESRAAVTDRRARGRKL